MKTSLFLLFILFNCLFNSVYGDGEIFDDDDFYGEISKDKYLEILEFFCIDREMGLFLCNEIFEDIYLCLDLIDYHMKIEYCPFNGPTSLGEKCDLIESMLKKMLVKSELSERRILILIHKFQKRFNCPVKK